MRFRRKLACVISTATPEEQPNLMPEECPGEIPIGAPDYCYMLVGHRKGQYSIIDRGCHPYKGVVAKGEALFYCTDQGCNMYNGEANIIQCRDANLTRLTWIASGNRYIKGWDCHNGNTWPPLCFNRVDGKLSLITNPPTESDLLLRT